MKDLESDEYWGKLTDTIVAANKPVNGHLKEVSDRLTAVEQHVASISQEHQSEARHRLEKMQEYQTSGGAKREWWQIAVAIAALFLAIWAGIFSSAWIIIQIIDKLFTK